ncbi:MAG: DNA mismatch repair protein MutS [Neisseria sp.]|nr:DNA mismatch repair protein MutS [Neisseria sp.]
MSLLLFLMSCQNDERKVQATQSIPAYADADAVFLKADFMIERGQVCFLGNEVYGKVDKFISIRCENGFEGFVADTSGWKYQQ